MANNIRNSLARYAGVIALVPLISGACFSSAYAEPGEKDVGASGVSEPSSHAIGGSLTDFETMELHYRRYSNAANNMAQLVKQLNQKIQDVSLAAKTVEAKSNSQNKRILEDKLRQLENARASSSHQYAQLQSQMQNEYRNYAAISSNLKAKYDNASGSKSTPETTKDVKDKSAKSKDSKAKTAKAKDSNVGETRNSPINDSQAVEPPAKAARLRDVEVQELRSRRDAAKGLNSGQAPSSAPSPTLNSVR
ncbi:MAG: hypothetical protein ABIV42_03180 [Nitrosospira sp.]